MIDKKSDRLRLYCLLIITLPSYNDQPFRCPSMKKAQIHLSNKTTNHPSIPPCINPESTPRIIFSPCPKIYLPYHLRQQQRRLRPTRRHKRPGLGQGITIRVPVHRNDACKRNPNARIIETAIKQTSVQRRQQPGSQRRLCPQRLLAPNRVALGHLIDESLTIQPLRTQVLVRGGTCRGAIDGSGGQQVGGDGHLGISLEGDVGVAVGAADIGISGAGVGDCNAAGEGVAVGDTSFEAVGVNGLGGVLTLDLFAAVDLILDAKSVGVDVAAVGRAAGVTTDLVGGAGDRGSSGASGGARNGWSCRGGARHGRLGRRAVNRRGRLGRGAVYRGGRSSSRASLSAA